MAVTVKTPVFRASECSALIGKGRKHPSGLSETGVRVVVKQWLRDKKNIRRYVTGKELRKGIQSEDVAISMLSDHDGKLLVKNRIRIVEPKIYLSGEADIVENNRITDIKCPWDAETFMAAYLKPEYEWQLRAYMVLWKKEFARLVYALTDCPGEVYDDEFRRFCWNEGIIDAIASDEEQQKLIDEFERSLLYSTNPLIKPSERLKIIEIERDELEEERLLEGLEKAADFYNSLTLNANHADST